MKMHSHGSTPNVTDFAKTQPQPADRETRPRGWCNADAMGNSAPELAGRVGLELAKAVEPLPVHTAWRRIEIRS
jgi:hypothetical protein